MNVCCPRCHGKVRMKDRANKNGLDFRSMYLYECLACGIDIKIIEKAEL